MSSGPLLEVSGVVKKFGGLVALDGVDLAVNPGTFSILAGPNGSGKTTLLNVISGIYRPERGRVVFDGVDITHAPPHVRARRGIARTFQTPRVAAKLSVLDNVVFGAVAAESPLDLRWKSREDKLARRALEILKLVNLDHMWDRPAAHLSGGQLKLLEIARALMADAKLILMDEPGAGLNPALAKQLFEFMRGLARRGYTLLVVEHRLDLAADYADYMYVLYNGRVLSHGRPDVVLSDKKVTEAFMA
jgi:branched-chain amino acid transport system ATP-binding protein